MNAPGQPSPAPPRPDPDLDAILDFAQKVADFEDRRDPRRAAIIRELEARRRARFEREMQRIRDAKAKPQVGEKNSTVPAPPPAQHPAAPPAPPSKPPRCPYCNERTSAGTYGTRASVLPVYFCPKTDAAGCPYGGQPVWWAAPVTAAQRAQVLEFEARRAASRRAASAASVRDMAGGMPPGLWTTAATMLFLFPLIHLGFPDEDGFHIPSWLLILLAAILFALLTYLRERHHAARHWAWHTHLSPPMRQDNTASPQTTTTPATTSAVSHETPMNTPCSARLLKDS